MSKAARIVLFVAMTVIDSFMTGFWMGKSEMFNALCFGVPLPLWIFLTIYALESQSEGQS